MSDATSHEGGQPAVERAGEQRRRETGWRKQGCSGGTVPEARVREETGGKRESNALAALFEGAGWPACVCQLIQSYSKEENTCVRACV